MIDQQLHMPVDWREEGEASLALETAEAAFAERCYLERYPLIPSAFVGHYTRAKPELGEPQWPLWARHELLFRCIHAVRAIRARDTAYAYYRDIYTPAARVAARERRTRAEKAAMLWREMGDRAALEEMLEAMEEIHAERGA